MNNPEIKRPSRLIEAALALEEELRRIAAASHDAQRLPLDSQLNLDFTTRKLEELGTMDQKLQPLVNALMEAVTDLAAVQQAHVTALTARAKELQRRREVFQKLQESYGSIADTVQDLHGLVLAFADAQKNDGATRFNQAPSLYILQQSMTELIEGAGQVSQVAKRENFGDMASQVESLLHQLHSARSNLNVVNGRHDRTDLVH